MKLTLLFCGALFLTACSSATFVGDRAPLPASTAAPDHFELPAHFAVARAIYTQWSAPGAEEARLWADLAHRAEDLGTFAPLIPPSSRAALEVMLRTAREQRFTYVLVVLMDPERGASDIVLYHTGSGAVMATAQAVAPNAGRRGVFGGRIRRPARLDRVTLRIAEATVPAVEEMLRGAALRQ